MKAYDPQNVLVTGGGGFLGFAIVRRLVERGDRVRSFSRGSYPALETIGVEQLRGDISDAKAVRKACKGMDVVFHTAAKPPPWGRYSAYHKTNVTGTQNVIDGCIRQNVARLVYTSTPSVVFDGTDMENVDESVPYPAGYNAFYPATKAAAERQVVNAAGSRLRTIALRPHQIWGPGDPHFAPRIIARAKKLRQVGEGKNLFDTTYIDNAADAHLLAADKLKENPSLSGNIYFISQGEPIPAWQMVNDILASAGLPPVKGAVSYRTAWVIGAVLEFVYRLFHLPGEPQMTRFLADAVAKSHWFDISAAKRDLGYTPGVSTREGLTRLEAWLKDGTAK
ncbi:MAG: NAD-dependent epimerase/dehydratase family protein [Deltaproteobacteria bacterium]|nr:NAD-dependent epimerase/dehydratase family protein [Deltaproteobacteria bacterium]